MRLDRLDPVKLAAEVMRRTAARDIADPVAFARLLIEPDQWQQDALTYSGPMLLNVARQCGKSSVCALMALHRAVAKPTQLILLVSPSDRQSGELFRKVRGYLKQLPGGVAPSLVEDNKRSLEFSNGSRIVSLPSSEDTIRGFSAVNLLIEDEAGDADDDLYLACRPMLAVSRGQLVLAGTPKGKRGHYWEAWSNAEAMGFRRVQVRADQISRIAPETLAAERVVLGAAYPQEYECEFLAGVFGRVYGAFDPARNLFVPPKDWKCDYHILGMDYGFNDNCSWNVIGWRDNDPTVYILESYKRGTTLPPDSADEAKALDRKYHFDRVVGDTGGMGKAYAEEARRRFSVPVDEADKHNKRGYIDLFNGAMSRGLVKIVEANCRQLLDEWPVLPWNEDRTKEAEGFPADCSDGTLYAWRAASNYHERPKDTPKPKAGTAEHARVMADRLEELATTEETVDWAVNQ